MAETVNIKDVLNDKKRAEMNASDDDDDWGDDWGDFKKDDMEIDLNKVDLKNKNLNKLGDAELAAYKKAMDKDFGAKQLKPGDPGFVYDKVVDFKNQGGAPLEDDSWGEDDGIEEKKIEGEEEEYYYDEEEEIVDEGQGKVMRASNLEDEEDYFDDDFDDDFA